jgi:hypothetical protein
MGLVYGKGHWGWCSAMIFPAVHRKARLWGVVGWLTYSSSLPIGNLAFGVRYNWEGYTGVTALVMRVIRGRNEKRRDTGLVGG